MLRMERSIAHITLALVEPRRFITRRESIQIARRRSLVIDPLAQQWTAVDHVDRELVALVLVGEIAPQRVVRIQAADRLEGKRLQAPRLERVGVVARAAGVDLHAAAEPTYMLVKRRLEPASAQAATMKPLRREGMHVLDDAPRIDIGSAEQFQWAGRAAPFRERRAFDHHRAREGARHP